MITTHADVINADILAFIQGAAVKAVWEKNDSFFVPPGAEAFWRDVPKAVVKFLDTGHFALETNLEEGLRLLWDFRSYLDFRKTKSISKRRTKWQQKEKSWY
jgi:hypothetical protein